MSVEKNINKCPACGALRPALAAECPECGYAFTNTTAKALSVLSEKLDALRKESTKLGRKRYQEQVIELISSFHIPHIKEEIMDVMYFIQPKALEKTSPISLAWRSRQREVFERAKIAYAHDKANLEKVTIYEKELDRIANQRFKNAWILTPTYLKIIAVCATLFIILLILPARDHSPNAYAERFTKAVSTEKYDKALKYLAKCPEMGFDISAQYLELIKGLINEGELPKAEQLINDRYSYVLNNDISVTNILKQLIEALIENNELEQALKYATDIDGLALIMKKYIENGDHQSAMNLYRANKSKFSKWDYRQNQKVWLCSDETIINFLKEQGE